MKQDIPLIFSGPMVRALLNSQLDTYPPAPIEPGQPCKGQTRRLDRRLLRVKTGDRLWVRETWAAPHCCDHVKPREITQETRLHYRASESGPSGLLWRPSIFMPRWASRILLEAVEDARNEHLQDLSEMDAVAEGIEPPGDEDYRGVASYLVKGSIAVDRYARLWDSLHADRPWASNPELAVLTFKVLEAKP